MCTIPLEFMPRDTLPIQCGDHSMHTRMDLANLIGFKVYINSSKVFTLPRKPLWKTTWIPKMSSQKHQLLLDHWLVWSSPRRWQRISTSIISHHFLTRDIHSVSKEINKISTSFFGVFNRCSPCALTTGSNLLKKYAFSSFRSLSKDWYPVLPYGEISQRW